MLDEMRETVPREFDFAREARLMKALGRAPARGRPRCGARAGAAGGADLAAPARHAAHAG